MTDLKTKIQIALNTVSAENGSNTPDFILAEYLINCLSAFETASNAREKWYGTLQSSLPAKDPVIELPQEIVNTEICIDRGRVLLKHILEKSKLLYSHMTDNHPTIPSYHFPLWDQLTTDEQNKWLVRIVEDYE